MPISSKPTPLLAELPESHQRVVHNGLHSVAVLAKLLHAAMISWAGETERAEAIRNAPPLLVLELGAMLQIGLWDLAGLRPWLPADVPSPREAVAELKRRRALGPHAFERPDQATLTECVLRTMCWSLSWDAAWLLEADIAIGELDEDELVHAVAPVLFALRHSSPASRKGKPHEA